MLWWESLCREGGREVKWEGKRKGKKKRKRKREGGSKTESLCRERGR